MSTIVERKLPTKALLFGLRAIGYSFSSAVADIIDNSISAHATRVDIYSDPIADVPFFCVLDNGDGMDPNELDNAMLPGSDRTEKSDSLTELGRFGLGLKSASLSQCREFIVASKKNGKLNAMAFDLDVIEEDIDNRFLLKQLSDIEVDSLPCINLLKQYQTGTLVIWIKFDKIKGLAKNFEDSFREAVSESQKHVELVFHRFYSELEIYYNTIRINKRDPFLLDSVGKQQTGRTIDIEMYGSIIKVTPYTLPFENTLTKSEKELLGNRGVYEEQGFYIYRNKRLLLWGSWLKMGLKSEFNKLARVQVDVPSSLDSVWMLDVKKSSARIPDKIKDRLIASVKDSIVRSKRTIKNPGIKEASSEHTIWDRINEKDGSVRYEINRANPLLEILFSSIDEHAGTILEVLLSQIEMCIPKYRIQNDVLDAIQIRDNGDTDVSVLEEQVVRFVSWCPVETREERLIALLNTEAYKPISDRKEKLLRRIRNEE